MCWGESLPDSFSVHPGRDRGYAMAEGMCAASEMGLFLLRVFFDFLYLNRPHMFVCVVWWWWYAAHEHEIVYSERATDSELESDFVLWV
jgi:hypothetical protein